MYEKIIQDYFDQCEAVYKEKGLGDDASFEEQKKSFLFYTLTYLWFRLLGLSGIVIRNFIDLRQHKFDENGGFSHKIPPLSCVLSYALSFSIIKVLWKNSNCT